MSVIDQAIKIPGDFRRDLMHHLDHGWVYSSPSAFGLARVVCHDWADEDFLDPEIYCLPEEGDCWYFTRVTGNVAEVLSRLPFPLERCAWHRHRGENIKIRHYDFRKFCRRFGAFPELFPRPKRAIGFLAH